MVQGKLLGSLKHAQVELADVELQKQIEILRQTLNRRKSEFPLPPRTDTEFLTKFIRCKKYNTEDTVKAIEKYYKHIYNNLNLVDGIRPLDFERFYAMNVISLLNSNVAGASVIYVTPANWIAKMATLRDLELTALFLFEELLQLPSVQSNGLVLVLDLAGFGFKHALHLSYEEIKFMLHCAFVMFPMRFRAIHLINVPLVFWPVYKIGIKLLPKKLQGRVQVHNELAKLATALGDGSLPKSLGGNLTEEGAWNRDFQRKILKENTCYDEYWKRGYKRDCSEKA